MNKRWGNLALSFLILLSLVVVVLGYVVEDHALLAAAWGVLLGFWGHVAFDEVAEHLGGGE